MQLARILDRPHSTYPHAPLSQAITLPKVRAFEYEFQHGFPTSTVARKSISAKAQRDLFQLDSSPINKICGKRSLMELLFFALAKSAWMKPRFYEQGPVSIEVPPQRQGHGDDLR